MGKIRFYNLVINNNPTNLLLFEPGFWYRPSGNAGTNVGVDKHMFDVVTGRHFK